MFRRNGISCRDRLGAHPPHSPSKTGVNALFEGEEIPSLTLPLIPNGRNVRQDVYS